MPPVFGDPRSGDVKHSMAAIDIARTKLGYSPVVSWQEGLRKTVEFYKELMVEN